MRGFYFNELKSLLTLQSDTGRAVATALWVIAASLRDVRLNKIRYVLCDGQESVVGFIITHPPCNCADTSD